jgi:hypothetical protein
MQTERIRQQLLSFPSPEDLAKFAQQGWKPIAIEWERELPKGAPLPKTSPVEGPPFGLRVGGDCQTLEENPEEKEVLTTIMELIIQDGPYSSIAQELNRRGFLTRQGGKWSPIAVFEMLPRLIEAAPKILSTEEWRQRRQQSLGPHPPLPI